MSALDIIKWWPRYEDGGFVNFGDKLPDFAHTIYKTAERGGRCLMAEILKPCPLCGSTDLKHYARDYRGNPLKRAVVRCESCGCEVDALSDNAVPLYEKYEWPDARKVATEQAMSRVAEKWNRRAERTCCQVMPPYEPGVEELPVCSECGRRLLLDDDDAYCPNCGARVVEP